MRHRILSWSIVLAGILFLITSCAGSPVRKAAGERIIAGPCSLSVPSCGEWEVKIDEGNGRVVLSEVSAGILQMLTAQEHVVTITIFPNAILNFEAWGKTADAHAEAFRDNELSTMQEKGVKPGLYSLSDVRKGTEILGGKKVYFLKYITASTTGGRSYSQDASLYLYFPDDFRVTHRFFGFLFSDMHTGVWLGKVDMRPLQEIIAGFVPIPTAGSLQGPGWELLLGAADGDVIRVQKALADGADANLPASEGTPLQLAALYGREEAANKLLEKGADPECSGPAGTTALMAAVIGGQEKMVELLLEQGANIETTTPKGTSALLLACATGQTGISRFLLDKGAKVNACGAGGVSPLWRAAYNGQGEIVRILLERGAALDAQAEDGWTPLMVAIDEGHPDIAAVLLDHGANVNLSSRTGWSALMAAVLKDQRETVARLISRGADVNARDKNGMTPLQVAKSLKKQEIIAMLQEAGAKE